MRLWTLHPKYLDPQGLVALWRESLLAQAVLLGQTRGYKHHPQLVRFRETPLPINSIATYLEGVCAEALRRGYCFNAGKICPAAPRVCSMTVTRGQLEYEWAHLKRKLRGRSPSWLAGLQDVSFPEPHPSFCIVPGTTAAWEIVRRSKVRE